MVDLPRNATFKSNSSEHNEAIRRKRRSKTCAVMKENENCLDYTLGMRKLA